jgi:hypothetical protein
MRSPASPDAMPIPPAPPTGLTDPAASAQPDALDPTAEPDAPVIDVPALPIDSKESDVPTAQSSALELEPVERACDPDEPYVFRHAASGREVVLARCVSVDGTPEPVDAPPLSNALVLLIQTHLDTLGFDPGRADGLIGPRTRDAIRRFQTDRGIEPTGAITFDLLDRLREPD